MGVITKLREALDEHKSLYVFSFDNMRSAKFKDVRIDWRDSRSVSRDASDGLIPFVTNQTAWGKARHQPCIVSTNPMMSISLLFLPVFMGGSQVLPGQEQGDAEGLRGDARGRVQGQPQAPRQGGAIVVIVVANGLGTWSYLSWCCVVMVRWWWCACPSAACRAGGGAGDQQGPGRGGQVRHTALCTPVLVAGLQALMCL